MCEPVSPVVPGLEPYEIVYAPVSPVVPGLEPYEIVYARDQQQYSPLPVLRSPQGVVLSRWKLTPDERAAIAEGADIYLSVHTFGGSLQPVGMQVARAPDPEQIEHDWELRRELSMRLALAPPK